MVVEFDDIKLLNLYKISENICMKERLVLFLFDKTRKSQCAKMKK